MTSSEKLQRWFVEPLRVLKEIPNGDGAFVALSIGCQLCERFYRAKTGTQEVQDGIPFQEEAGRALGVGEDRFKRFWKAFRHGMQHQGSPKTYQQGGIDYKWRISSSYNVVPDEVVIDPTTTVIQIDPWKFAEDMILRFVAEPDVLDDAISHAFGDVYQEN
jgi:hypothetical protein